MICVQIQQIRPAQQLRGPEGPGSLTCEIGQNVKVEPLSTPTETQFENKR